MDEEVKTKQGEDRISYFYKSDKSKGEYLAPIVYALIKDKKISKEQEKIFLKDFIEFEIPLLPAKKVKRTIAGKEVAIALYDYFAMAHIRTKLGEPKHYYDPFKNTIDSAFYVVYLHLQGKDRNGKEDDKVGKIYDDVFDRYKEKIDLEAWKNGNLEDSEKEAADALEEEIEILLVGALAEEIAESLTLSADEKALFHVSDQKDEEGEPIDDDWGAIHAKLENRDDNPQETSLEEAEFEGLCKEFSDHITDKIVDFIEIKDGRSGKIKRFYKRDDRYKIYRQENNDNKWVEEILANGRLKEEGDYAVNLALFFTWNKNNARTIDGIYSLEKYVGYVQSKGGPRQNTSTEDDHSKNIFMKTVEIFLEKWLDKFQDADDDERKLLREIVYKALHKMKTKYSMKNLKTVLRTADNDKCEEILEALIINLLAHMDAEKRTELKVNDFSIEELRLIAEIFMEKRSEKKEEEEVGLEMEVRLFLEKLLEEIQNEKYDKSEMVIKKLVSEIELADSDKHELIYQLFFGKSEDDKVSDEQGLQEINSDLDNLDSKSEERKKYYKELKGKYNAMLTFFYETLVEQFKERKPEIIL